jgi:tRNA A37 N6-isopentenylltransferase MiaA
MKPTTIDAVLSLVPDAKVVVRGQEVEWLEQPAHKPTEAEISDEVARLTAEYERSDYQRQRAAEYPPFADYLDGIVKGDAAQVQAYKDACLAVKAKYPKPQ